jgi:hypothetical protein
VPTRIVRCDDGVMISWLRTRFIPYDDVVDVRSAGRLLEIGTKAGRSFGLYVKRGTTLHLQEPLVRKLSSYRERRNELDPRMEQRFARSGHTAQAWAEGLLQLIPNPTYRSAGVLEEAWCILEDFAALPDARLGAAVVLRAVDGSTNTLARIRDIADASAPSPIADVIRKVTRWSGDRKTVDALLAHGIRAGLPPM